MKAIVNFMKGVYQKGVLLVKSAYQQGKALIVSTALVAVTAFSSAVHAAVPAGVDTAFTTVGADAATVAGYAVPIVLSVLGLGLVIKLIKRFGNKI